MKRDFQWLIWAFILGVSALAASCGERKPTANEQYHESLKPRTDYARFDSIERVWILKNSYPYDWPPITYTKVSYDNFVSESCSLPVIFDEKYIEIERVGYMGEWLDRCTFKTPLYIFKITFNTMTVYTTILDKYDILIKYER